MSGPLAGTIHHGYTGCNRGGTRTKGFTADSLGNSNAPRLHHSASRGLSVFFKNERLDFRCIETGGHIGIAGWVAGNGELSAFNPVYGVNSLANGSGIGTFENCTDELLRIRLFSKCEDSFAPVLGLWPVEVECISRENNGGSAFR